MIWALLATLSTMQLGIVLFVGFVLGYAVLSLVEFLIEKFGRYPPG